MQQSVNIESAVAVEVSVPDGLIYVSDTEPGFRRLRAGKGFRYIGPDGKTASAADRERMRKLGIPPAYERVWICASCDGHLQATGYDARGRKQYRYHPLWGSARSETKFQHLSRFAQALPTVRARVRRDLRRTPGDRSFTLAALILLLDRTFLRIGNTEYAATNRSFGATTLLVRHLKVKDGAVLLSFRAKGGKRVQRTLRDKRLNRILQDIGDLPGRHLFSYLDEDGHVRTLASHHINAWLTEVAGPGMTAKTFRTWGGTLAAFEVARAVPADGKLTLSMMAEAAAEQLDNTPTISRKSYIHPAVLELAQLSGEDRVDLLNNLTMPEMADLREPERHLLAFLLSVESRT